MEELSNEDKIGIVRSHIKNLKYAEYGAELDLAQAQAVLEPVPEVIANIEKRLSDIQAQLVVLNTELSTLESA